MVLNEFVIKFAIFGRPPRGQIRDAIKYFVSESKAKGVFNKYFCSALVSIFSPVFEGIVANWNECWFYYKSKNPFLVSTAISLFGIINFQKKVEAIEGSVNPIGSFPFNLIGEKAISYEIEIKDSRSRTLFFHNLFGPNNFGWDKDGYLVILDYGSKSIFGFILQHGEELHKIKKLPT